MTTNKFSYKNVMKNRGMDVSEGLTFHEWKRYDYDNFPKMLNKMLDVFREDERIIDVQFEIEDIQYKDLLNKSYIINYTLQKKIVKITLTDINNSTYTINITIPELNEDGYYVLNNNKKFSLYQFVDMPYTRRIKYSKEGDIISDEVRLANNIVFYNIFYSKKMNARKIRVNKVDYNLLPFMVMYVGSSNVEFKKIKNGSKSNYIPVFLNEYEPLNKLLKLELSSINKLNTKNDKIKLNTMQNWYKLLVDYSPRYRRITSELYKLIKWSFQVDVYNSQFYDGDPLMMAIKYFNEKNTNDYPNNMKLKRVRIMEYLSKNIQNQFIYILKTIPLKPDTSVVRNIVLSHEFTNSEIVSNVQNSAKDTVYNPLLSYSELCRGTYFGTGGFFKDASLVAIRDIHPSYIGEICTVWTPDRESAGGVFLLKNQMRLNELGRIINFPTISQ